MKPPSAGTPLSLAVLKGTGVLWFLVAYAGQLFFAFYTAAYYGGSALRGEYSVRAFTSGLAPMTIGLLLATGWVLTDPARGHPGLLVLVAITVAVMWRSKLSPIWMVGVGMVAGALGWV